LPAGPGAKLTVVWLQGEHDIATKDVLAATIARAIALNETAVVIDLSGVQFIDAATIGVIVAARQFLRRRSRSLVLRSPPACVLRVFDVCDLNDLLHPSECLDAGDAEKGAAALGSWVKVPATGRVDRHDNPVTVKPHVGARVSVESERVERGLSVRIP